MATRVVAKDFLRWHTTDVCAGALLKIPKFSVEWVLLVQRKVDQIKDKQVGPFCENTKLASAMVQTRRSKQYTEPSPAKPPCSESKKQGRLPNASSEACR
jgi:hypothetical protein